MPDNRVTKTLNSGTFSRGGKKALGGAPRNVSKRVGEGLTSEGL